jgi:hypothetical protein
MNATAFYSSQGSQRKSGHATIFLVVLAFLAVGAAFWTVTAGQAQISPTTHAALKHGVSADQAAFCFSGGGELQLSATNPRNGRCATVATMLSKFFIRIQEPDGNEVTMFCKEKMQCIDQVKQYLKNRGYDIH